MSGEFQEGGVLFADAVENANRAVLLVAEPDDLTAGCAKHGTQRVRRIDRRAEVLFEKSPENVRQDGIQR